MYITKYETVMEEKHNEATLARPEGNRTVDADMVNIDLNKYIRQLKDEEAWINNKRNAITVFKSEHLRLVLIALHQDAGLPEHTADGTISVQVLEGHIVFKTNNEEVKLLEKNMVTLHEKIPHSVVAMEDSIFLLTIAVK